MRGERKTLFLLLGLFLLILAQPARANIIDDIKAKILDRTQSIQQLDAEIKQFTTQLQTTQQKAQTLQGEIKTIDTTRTQLAGNIKDTEGKITATSQTISSLATQIGSQEAIIAKHKVSLGESLRAIHELDNSGLLEAVLSKEDLSGLLNETAALSELNANIDNNINQLRGLITDLGQKKSTQEQAKASLAAAKSKLADQKALADAAKKAKDDLLKITKNQESNYQKLLADRLAKKQAVEAEISQFESELKVVIDPNSLPASGSGILKWPLDKIIITQYFGLTSFATQNPQVYNGKGHNGVDFGTPVGTPVKAALSGTVTGSGNTDLTCVGASYGKWILIKHENGLSTLYAHLSLIKVTAGQTVTTGDIIGYSGNTGYSTGPHLHFTVFATPGVEITQLKSKVASCGVYTLPVASQSSYLNPLSYL